MLQSTRELAIQYDRRTHVQDQIHLRAAQHAHCSCGGEEGGTHMHERDIHDGMLESRLCLESGLRTLEVVTITQKSVGAG